jgi:hypothetical protein
MSLRLGVKGKMMAGPVMIVFDPSLGIASTNGIRTRTICRSRCASATW